MRSLPLMRVLLALLLTAIVLYGCGSNTEEEAAPELFEVQRGPLVITIPADGNLVMPQQVELRFGTFGGVKQVYVEEGDFVRAGTLLAKLDDTGKKLDIKTAQYDLQLIMSNLAETISVLARLMHFPRNYPSKGALTSYEQAQSEVSEAQRLLATGEYDEATALLHLADHDLSISVRLLEAPLQYMGTYSPDASTESVDRLEVMFYQYVADEIDESMQQIGKVQQALNDVVKYIEQGNYESASKTLTVVQADLADTHGIIRGVIEKVEKRYGSDPDVIPSLGFLYSAQDELTKCIELIKDGNIGGPVFAYTLQAVEHDLDNSMSVLENKELVLEHGLSLKTEQDYKLDVEKAKANLRQYREELLKTALFAPFDGVVVDVGVSEDEQLSSRDYSSRTAVHLVDIREVTFEGKVSERDVLQVKVGQKANIIVDALPGKPLSGMVTFIARAGDKAEGTVDYALTIELEPTQVALKGGLTATADIIIQNLADVLFIPLESVIQMPEGQFAEVLDEATGNVERRPITVGIESHQFAEVQSGLREGEKVVVPKPKLQIPSSQPRRGGGFLRGG